jgi:hypothetical protein
VDWGAAVKFSLIAAGIIAAAVLAVFVFDAVWARVGFGAAALVLIGALYLVKRWGDRDARRARERFERG